MIIEKKTVSEVVIYLANKKGNKSVFKANKHTNLIIETRKEDNKSIGWWYSKRMKKNNTIYFFLYR